MSSIIRASLLFTVIRGNIKVLIKSLNVMKSCIKINSNKKSNAKLVDLATTTMRIDLNIKYLEVTSEDLAESKVFSNNLHWEIITKGEAKEIMLANLIILVEMAEVVKLAKTVVARGMDNLARGKTMISLLNIRGSKTPTTKAQCSVQRS